MYEEILEIPELGEPKNLKELINQIAIISEAIGKCEKILQHLAISSENATDFKEFMSKHIHLISMKNLLYKKMKLMEKGDEEVVTLD